MGPKVHFSGNYRNVQKINISNADQSILFFKVNGEKRMITTLQH